MPARNAGEVGTVGVAAVLEGVLRPLPKAFPWTATPHGGSSQSGLCAIPLRNFAAKLIRSPPGSGSPRLALQGPPLLPTDMRQCPPAGPQSKRCKRFPAFRRQGRSKSSVGVRPVDVDEAAHLLRSSHREKPSIGANSRAGGGGKVTPAITSATSALASSMTSCRAADRSWRLAAQLLQGDRGLDPGRE